MSIVKLTATVPEELSGLRLDQLLAKLFTDYSRSRLQNWIKAGAVTVDNTVLKAKEKISTGQHIQIHAEIEDQTKWQAQNIKLTIVYEDAELLVIDKPPGLVVHPAVGNADNTLLNALLHYAPELAEIPRAGIIHRLDKDTSGLLVIARTLASHKYLVNELKKHRIKREYEAIVSGVMISGGTVDLPIGRHPTQRIKMAVIESGKPATTHYRVIERYRAHTRLKVILETGRTHQIRVHLAHIHYPIVGDPVYGGRLKLAKGIGEDLRQCLIHCKRQALHAKRLALIHPKTKELIEWKSSLPDDLEHLINVLREDLQHE